MTFKTDTLLNATANGNTSSASLSATATTIEPPLQMSSHDLNLEEIWRRVATTTVKLLHKRNANSDIHRQTTDGGAAGSDTGGDDNDYHVGNDSDSITDELLNKNEHETTVTTTATEAIANNLTATITSIRSNVTKVLYMYFHPNQTVTDDYMNTDDVRLNDTSSQHATHLHKVVYESDEPFGNLSKGDDEENPLTKVKSTLATKIATAVTSEIFQPNSTYNNSINGTTATTIISTSTESNNDNNNNSNGNVLLTTLTQLKKFLNATTATTNNSLIATTTTSTTTPAVVTTATSATTIARNITYPSINIHSYENCSALFANYTQPHNQQGE